jgi:hypothetical protein
MGRPALVVLALLAGLLAPAPSHAAGPPDATLDAGIRRAVALAWPGGPCTATYVLRIVDRHVVEDLTGAAGAAGAASAGDPTCSVYAARDVTADPIALCQLVVHEAGHLNGHEHVDDPASIMHPELDPQARRQPGCTWRALLGPRFVSESAALRHVLVDGWRLYDAWRDARGRMVVRGERRTTRGRGWERRSWTVTRTTLGVQAAVRGPR